MVSATLPFFVSFSFFFFCLTTPVAPQRQFFQISRRLRIQAKRSQLRRLPEKKEQQGTDYQLLWILLGGSGLLLILASIWMTQIKRKNQALAAAMAEADQSKLFKREFLVNMSHEIRTPMNAIMGLTNLTLNTRLTQRQHDYLQKIDKSAGNLLAIINNLLDYSKIDHGELEVEVISFRLDTVLDNLAGMVRLKAEKKGLEIVFKTDNEVPLQLQGDLRNERITILITHLPIKVARYT